ncbi:hypothetical protein VdG2_07283 [Verticillium dahliae VDG2]|nr:hypothetical protein VdG2_07283 [Verticillium dahliae VDG2]
MVSITGCGLLFMMLGSIDQSPRLSWHGFLNIEPNTYIAIIATASRTAITVPIASCLSQLKWRHFQNRAHRLNHLDLIDKASRGPWGSLQALFMLGKANMVISMLAITTILSLAIGPSVQQVLEIHTREAIDYSLVPELAYATNYTSKVLYTTQTPDDWTTRRYLPWSTEPLRRRDLDDRDDSVYWVAPSTNAEMVLDPQSRDYVMDTVAFFLKEILIITLETLCVTLLLAFTVISTRKDSLVKDSSFALLVHNLSGWDKVRVPELENAGALDRLAKTMTAKLEADEDGILNFRPQDGGRKGSLLQ